MSDELETHKFKELYIKKETLEKLGLSHHNYQTYNLNFPIYHWEPKEDITAHELALCVPMMTMTPADVMVYHKNLPDNCKRHWRVE